MRRLLLLLFPVILVLAGCSSESTESIEKDSYISPFEEVEVAQITLSFDRDSAETDDDGSYLDLSHLSQGYVGAFTENQNTKVAFQVSSTSQNGTMSYVYELTPNVPMFAPINMGDGQYTFSLMINTTENRYATLLTVSRDVVLENDFMPYLIPTVFSDFNQYSDVAQFAQELTKDCENKGEAVSKIYDWVASNISYDNEKAQELSGALKWYVPDSDDTFNSKKGICIDYASLASIMLRSIGIPSQVTMGYIDPGDLYHAWNMIYLDGEWITVKFEINENEWNRLDLTFAASRSDQSMLADDYSYTPTKTY